MPHSFRAAGRRTGRAGHPGLQALPVLVVAAVVGCGPGEDATNAVSEEVVPPVAAEVAASREGADPAGPAGALGSCEMLPEALRMCTATTCGSPHPIVRDFTVRHEVEGRDEDGACGYTRSMTSDMRMVCAFDEPSAARYADEIEATVVGAKDSVGVSSGGDGPNESPMSGKCVVLDADGDTVGVL